MKRLRLSLDLLALAGVTGAICWYTAMLCFRAHANRSVGSLILLLEVLSVASKGDWILAVSTSIAASLSFSYFFIESVGSFNITTMEGAVTFLTMLITGLVGSQLAIRAQRRASEAIRRREEMERLQQLGTALLAAGSLAEAAGNVVEQIVRLFGVSGALMRVSVFPEPFVCGLIVEPPGCQIELRPGGESNQLVLYGDCPSAEVRNALGNLVNLVLDRARSTEERARIEAAQRGEELRNTVLNALAHNFKTPLTSIKAAASMLRNSGSVSSPHDRELAVVIDEEADRLNLLIRESLNLARIEAHQQNPQLEPCSVHALAEAVVSRVARYLGNREFIVDVPDDLPPLIGDRFLFEQMLTLVVDNAWKYSQPDARVWLTAEQQGDRVLLTVQNEGKRIPDDESSKIFGKFYRGALNRIQVEGTGLGLPIAMAIAEAHGGSLWLDNESAGPAFRFALPVDSVSWKRE